MGNQTMVIIAGLIISIIFGTIGHFMIVNIYKIRIKQLSDDRDYWADNSDKLRGEHAVLTGDYARALQRIQELESVND